MRSVFCEGFKK